MSIPNLQHVSHIAAIRLPDNGTTLSGNSRGEEQFVPAGIIADFVSEPEDSDFVAEKFDCRRTRIHDGDKGNLPRPSGTATKT